MKWPVIRSDGEGYYAYLPMWFVHHTNDVSILVEHSENKLAIAGALQHEETGRWFLKYPAGVAIFLMPFFLLVHMFCSITGLAAADGYTFPYQIAVIISATFYTALGLWFLYRWLIKRFDSRAVQWTLLLTAFATGLAHHAIHDAFLAHVYAFFLLSALLHLSDRFFVQPDWRKALLIGACSGMLFLTRNYLVLLSLLVLHPFFESDWKRILPNLRYFIAMFLVSVGFIGLHYVLLYWQSGSWVAYAYKGESFDFQNPMISDVWFSFKKGLFVHHPIVLLMLFGVFIGLKNKSHRVASLWTLFYFLVFSYLIGSWWCWWFGGSFGHRGFVDIYPLFAFGLAVLIHSATSRWRRILKWICVLLLIFNLNLMHAYWRGDWSSENVDSKSYARLPKKTMDALISIAGDGYDFYYWFKHGRSTREFGWQERVQGKLEVLSQSNGKYVVKATNTGSIPWKHYGQLGKIVVGLFSGKDNLSPMRKIKLPETIAPGESIELSFDWDQPNPFYLDVYRDPGGRFSMIEAGEAMFVKP